jgi:hypothetical protein
MRASSRRSFTRSSIMSAASGTSEPHAGSPPLGEPEVRRALRFTAQVLRNLLEIPAVLADIASEAESDVEAEPQSAG